MRKPVSEELKERILVLDGAMGTMIQSLSLGEDEFRGKRFAAHPSPLKGLNDILCLTRPQVISDIHRQYIEAGADIIETNTFNSNLISLAEYGLGDLVEETNLAGARLAREAAGDSHYVAGSMGPTGISLSIPTGHRITFDQLAETYRVQASALIRGGVDLLLVETVFDTLNAKAAVYGIEQAFEQTGRAVPIMISATLTESGRVLSGQTPEGFVTSVSRLSDYILSLGLNCGFGAREMMRFLPRLKDISKYVSVHPNAGLPDEMGRYTETPLSMVWKIRSMIKDGMVNIVGGCCGTTPKHIEAIAAEVRGKAPRKPGTDKTDTIELAGLERFDYHGFIKVGERCNVAGSRKFLRLISERKFEEAKEIAVSQLDNGAKVIDINMDDAMLDSKRCMTEFVNLLNSDPATASVPIMIDSSDIEVIFAALKMLQGRPLVNSISLKEGEERFIHNAREIKRLGGVVIVMAFDEKGQADTLERRIEICGRAFKILTEKVGMRPGDIVFDPNVLTVGTGIKAHDNYAIDFLNATRWIHENLNGSRVVGGISNLSFAFRGHNRLREAIHTVFLHHAIRRGLGLAIVNPATSLDIESLPGEWMEAIEDLLFNRREDSGMRLLELVSQSEENEKKGEDSQKSPNTAEKGAGDSQKSDKSDITSPAKNNFQGEENRKGSLPDLLMRGTVQGIEQAIKEELSLCGGSAMRVVNESLIATMNRIGELFGAGRMFLPQVVRSATVMKEAVRIMSPLIEKESTSINESRTTKKIVLATVKGDVHDIGKNIVGIVLRCSGYEVIDLGVMVTKEVIVDKALETGADFIGLSGLISPSLKEMGEVIGLLEERGMRLPVFIGGAATSALHTAVRLAPGYSGPVIHTVDAAALPGIAREFADPSASVEARSRNTEQQRRLREKYEEKQNLVSLDEARRRANRVTSPMAVPKETGTLTYEVKVSELTPLINWRAFLGEWKVDPNGETTEGRRLVEEAKGILEDKATEIGAIARCVIAKSRRTDRDEIILDDKVSIPLLRRQSPMVQSGECPALSDYVAEEGDSIGVFCVTVLLPDEEMDSEIHGTDLSKQSREGSQSGLRGERDSYGSILRQTLNHRLAEAATEWLHQKVSTEVWGLSEKSGVRPAVGYPSLPDQSLIFVLDKIVRFGEIGISLTENGAMNPPSSTAGLILPSPYGKYFSVGPVDDKQLRDYEERRQNQPIKDK